jgi:hypothetical protein
MKQRLARWSLPAVVCMAAMIVASIGEYAYARGRGGGGFARGDFSRGGFSREGPAAAGGFASRLEGMRGPEGGFQASRQQFASGAQANRMDYGEHAQASRQQEANALQSSREQAARNLQSNAQQYRRNYPYWGAGYRAWDAGAGWAAAATGAAIGGAAAAASMAAPAYPNGAYASGQPCANPEAVPVGPETFFRCDSGWYRQAYGPSGPVFIAVRPPL